jgi:hypothetical protein
MEIDGLEIDGLEIDGMEIDDAEASANVAGIACDRDTDQSGLAGFG